MRFLQRCAAAALAGLFAAMLLISPAIAQTATPSPAFPPIPIAPVPAEKPGICAPWHKCIAEGTLVAVGLYLFATAGMYMIQRRGFDSIQPRQGNPRGVPVQKK